MFGKLLKYIIIGRKPQKKLICTYNNKFLNKTLPIPNKLMTKVIRRKSNHIADYVS